MNVLGKSFNVVLKAASSQAKLSTVNYRIFCCIGCPSSRNGKRERGKRRKKREKKKKKKKEKA